MRVRQREQAYSIVQLKEYMPEYDNRMVYVQNRTASELQAQPLPDHHRDPRTSSTAAISPSTPESSSRPPPRRGRRRPSSSTLLLEVQKRLETLAKLRDREPERRWQAHYDLILAQTVAFQVKAYEYRALMAQIIKKPPAPSKQPTPDLAITFVVDHAKEPLAPKNRDRQEVRRGQAAARGRHRQAPQDPLGRPRPGHPRPRLQRQAQRVAPQPQVRRARRSSCRSIEWSMVGADQGAARL